MFPKDIRQRTRKVLLMSFHKVWKRQRTYEPHVFFPSLSIPQNWDVYEDQNKANYRLHFPISEKFVGSEKKLSLFWKSFLLLEQMIWNNNLSGKQTIKENSLLWYFLMPEARHLMFVLLSRLCHPQIKTFVLHKCQLKISLHFLWLILLLWRTMPNVS